MPCLPANVWLLLWSSLSYQGTKTNSMPVHEDVDEEDRELQKWGLTGNDLAAALVSHQIQPRYSGNNDPTRVTPTIYRPWQNLDGDWQQPLCCANNQTRATHTSQAVVKEITSSHASPFHFRLKNQTWIWCSPVQCSATNSTSRYEGRKIHTDRSRLALICTAFCFVLFCFVYGVVAFLKFTTSRESGISYVTTKIARVCWLCFVTGYISIWELQKPKQKPKQNRA